MEEKRLRKLAGLSEGLGNDPLEAQNELADELKRAAREMEDIFLGPALDTRDSRFDKAGVRKVLGLFKKIDNDLKKIRKTIDTIEDLGL